MSKFWNSGFLETQKKQTRGILGQARPETGQNSLGEGFPKKPVSEITHMSNFRNSVFLETQKNRPGEFWARQGQSRARIPWERAPPEKQLQKLRIWGKGGPLHFGKKRKKVRGDPYLL